MLVIVLCPDARRRRAPQAVDKVLEEFSKHDKLSVEQFETLAEMVEKAHQLHRENNLLEAEKLYTEVSPLSTTWATPCALDMGHSFLCPAAHPRLPAHSVCTSTWVCKELILREVLRRVKY
eukprot:2076934-Rhodomonas_salina.2